MHCGGVLGMTFMFVQHYENIRAETSAVRSNLHVYIYFWALLECYGETWLVLRATKSLSMCNLLLFSLCPKLVLLEEGLLLCASAQ